MTTATRSKKTTKKQTPKKADMPPLPPTAKVVEIGGRDCVIVPLDEYDDWLQDAILTAVGADRLKRGGGETVPFEETVARINGKRKKR